jgi:centromere/kinetochore protein ZW10
MIDSIPITRTRALRLVDDRCFALRRFIHEQLEDAWGNLVHWSRGDKKSLTIRTVIEDGHTSLEEAVTSWRAFKELEAIANQLWQTLDDSIIKPRIDIRSRPLSSISILEVSTRRHIF